MGQTARFLSSVSLVASLLMGWLGMASPVAAACDKQLTYSDHTPQAGSNGARMTWLARITNAPDYASGGFASQVLWVGTNGDQADDSWVEVGVTHGFAGANVWTFYSARAINSASYDEYRYTTMTPAVGVAYRFIGRSGTNGYWGEIQRVSTGATISKFWSGNATPTVNYSGGLEATCNTGRVDRTYVSVNQFRRSSDGVYVNIDNGTLTDLTTDPDAGTAWCAQPTRFRYWLNSSIDPTLCS